MNSCGNIWRSGDLGEPPEFTVCSGPSKNFKVSEFHFESEMQSCNC